MKKWKFNSWENFEAKHLPQYKDKKLLDEVKAQISSFCLLYTSDAADES